MLDSIPVPMQAILWPLVGTAIILALGRLLPDRIRRLVALAAALAALWSLWSLQTRDVEEVALFWEPLNFFRLSPALYVDGLSLWGGIVLAGVTAALVVGVRGAKPRRTAWHGLILVALAGCLATMMAGNLLTLALGSALIDLALIAVAILAAGGAGRRAWRMAVPGVASTLVLFAGAVQMSTQVGTASLLVANLPAGILTLMGVAGLLRLMVFPLHPRGLNTPENAATLILLAGAGTYLLARTQAIAPALATQSWMLVIGGIALLAGGLQAWTGSVGSAAVDASMDVSIDVTTAEAWPGMAVHRTGYALAFVLLLAGVMPWPLVDLPLILGLLAIWWDSSLEREAASHPQWLEGMRQWLGSWVARIRPHTGALPSILERWRRSWLGRRGTMLLPTLALASLAGVPFTVGARGRWSLYAILLKRGNALLLLAALAADAFLAAALWSAFARLLVGGKEYRPRPAAILAMVALAMPMIALGIAPGALERYLDLKPAIVQGISVWGLGFVYGLPWLLGAWLARVGSSARRYLGLVRQGASLDWLFSIADWIGQRLVDATHWLGRVGEGEGWLGWALVILSLGVIFLTAR